MEREERKDGDGGVTGQKRGRTKMEAAGNPRANTSMSTPRGELQ